MRIRRRRRYNDATEKLNKPTSSKKTKSNKPKKEKPTQKES